MAAGSTPGSQNGQRRLPLDERERHRLGEAGGVQHPPDGCDRGAIRSSGAACGVASAGNVAGSRSKP